MARRNGETQKEWLARADDPGMPGGRRQAAGDGLLQPGGGRRLLPLSGRNLRRGRGPFLFYARHRFLRHRGQGGRLRRPAAHPVYGHRHCQHEMTGGLNHHSREAHQSW